MLIVTQSTLSKKAAPELTMYKVFLEFENG